MSSTPTADELEATARALLNDRISAIRTLAHTRQALEKARAALNAAEKADADAYAAARRAGWSADELRKFGFGVVTRRRLGRPRRAAYKPSVVRVADIGA